MILQAEVSDLLLESMPCFLYGLIQCKESHHDELKFTDFGHCSLGSKCLSCIGYTKEECSKREGASKAPNPLRRFVTWDEHKQPWVLCSGLTRNGVYNTVLIWGGKSMTPHWNFGYYIFKQTPQKGIYIQTEPFYHSGCRHTPLQPWNRLVSRQRAVGNMPHNCLWMNPRVRSSQIILDHG
jgi:hypothetical protein